MKRLLIILAFISSAVLGQPLEKRVAQKYCECFSKVDQANVYEASGATETCLRQALIDYRPEVEKLTDTVKEDSNKELRYNAFILDKVQVEMIYQCDKYFQFYENKRWAVFKPEADEKQKKQIEERQRKKIIEITEKISEAPYSQHYLTRATTYFLLKEFNLARKDLDTLMMMGENQSEVYMLKGFISELNGEYQDAINNYMICKTLIKNSEMESYIAICRRKAKQK